LTPRTSASESGDRRRPTTGLPQAERGQPPDADSVERADGEFGEGVAAEDAPRGGVEGAGGAAPERGAEQERLPLVTGAGGETGGGEAEDERGRGGVEPERAPDDLGDVAGLVGDGAAGVAGPLVHDDGVGPVGVVAAVEADT